VKDSHLAFLAIINT